MKMIASLGIVGTLVLAGYTASIAPWLGVSLLICHLMSLSTSK